MPTRAKLFLVYTWATVIAWYGLIYLFSNIQYLDERTSYSQSLLTSLGYELLFAFQFLLIFRAILLSLKLKIDRLSFWKSLREKSEDVEFTQIIEIFIMITSVLATVILAIIDEYHQASVTGRVASVEDVFLALIGILFSALLVFVIPVLSEFEARMARVRLPKTS